MKKKILYVASLDTHLTSFHLPYINWFMEQGCEVHLVYKGPRTFTNVDKIWKLNFERSPFKKSNFRIYKELKNIIDSNSYDLIHCHTPMASFVTRLAAINARKKGTKVLYTAHGFHFYKGGSIKNWIIFYPIEKFMSKYTDAIVTINQEDFDILYQKKFLSKGKYHICGIGIDPSRLNIINKDKRKLKEELSFSDKDFIILYIAELIDRKNHRFILNSIPELIHENNNIKILFAGGGSLMNKMKILAEEKGIEKNVEFLGFRKEIGKYISISDIGISASKQEGLGLGVAEMMFNGLPVVVTQDRGHREMVEHGLNGYIYEQGDNESFIKYLDLLYKNEELRNRIGKNAKESMEKFKIENSLKSMIEIYKQYI